MTRQGGSINPLADALGWLALAGFVIYTTKHITNSLTELSTISKDKTRRPRRVGNSSFFETGLRAQDTFNHGGLLVRMTRLLFGESSPATNGTVDALSEEGYNGVHEPQNSGNGRTGPQGKNQHNPEDDIPLDVLNTLAHSPVYDIREAAIKVLIHCFVRHSSLLDVIHSVHDWDGMGNANHEALSATTKDEFDDMLNLISGQRSTLPEDVMKLIDEAKDAADTSRDREAEKIANQRIMESMDALLKARRAE